VHHQFFRFIVSHWHYLITTTPKAACPTPKTRNYCRGTSIQETSSSMAWRRDSLAPNVCASSKAYTIAWSDKSEKSLGGQYMPHLQAGIVTVSTAFLPRVTPAKGLAPAGCHHTTLKQLGRGLRACLHPPLMARRRDREPTTPWACESPPVERHSSAPARRADAPLTAAWRMRARVASHPGAPQISRPLRSWMALAQGAGRPPLA